MRAVLLLILLAIWLPSAGAQIKKRKEVSCYCLPLSCRPVEAGVNWIQFELQSVEAFDQQRSLRTGAAALH